MIQYLLAPNGPPTQRLPKYATISREWQSSHEYRMFRTFKIDSDDLEAFESLFTGSSIVRREYVISLQFEFLFPPVPNSRGCCAVEHVPDREADSLWLTNTLAELFFVLADV